MLLKLHSICLQTTDLFWLLISFTKMKDFLFANLGCWMDPPKFKLIIWIRDYSLWARNVVQWWGPCLACTKSCAIFPAPHKSNSNKELCLCYLIPQLSLSKYNCAHVLQYTFLPPTHKQPNLEHQMGAEEKLLEKQSDLGTPAPV